MTTAEAAGHTIIAANEGLGRIAGAMVAAVRSAFSNRSAAPIAGPSFLQQEPDLAKEARLNVED